MCVFNFFFCRVFAQSIDVCWFLYVFWSCFPVHRSPLRLTARDDAWRSSESNLTFTRNQHTWKFKNKISMIRQKNCIAHFDFFRARLNFSSIDALLVLIRIRWIWIQHIFLDSKSLLFEIFGCDPTDNIRIESNDTICDSITKLMVCLTLLPRKKTIPIGIGCLDIPCESKFCASLVGPMRHFADCQIYSWVQQKSTSDSRLLFVLCLDSTIRQAHFFLAYTSFHNEYWLRKQNRWRPPTKRALPTSHMCAGSTAIFRYLIECN